MIRYQLNFDHIQLIADFITFCWLFQWFDFGLCSLRIFQLMRFSNPVNIWSARINGISSWWLHKIHHFNSIKMVTIYIEKGLQFSMDLHRLCVTNVNPCRIKQQIQSDFISLLPPIIRFCLRICITRCELIFWSNFSILTRGCSLCSLEISEVNSWCARDECSIHKSHESENIY